MIDPDIIRSADEGRSIYDSPGANPPQSKWQLAEDYQILARNTQSYQPNRWYQLRVVLDGPKIQVYIDGQLDLQATDDTLAKGTVALYSWGSAGAKFRNVRIKN